MHHNSVSNVKPALAQARAMRSAPTPAEYVLWQHLRRRGLAGRKFRRQHAIGPYIADFFCVSERLVIEVDGPTHHSPSRIEHDAARTANFTQLGLSVVRVTDDEVLHNLPIALSRIETALSL